VAPILAGRIPEFPNTIACGASVEYAGHAGAPGTDGVPVRMNATIESIIAVLIRRPSDES
jgi:hypothetical protein